MAEIDLKLTDEQAAYLIRLLEATLGETRVEARHTRTNEFRELVRGEESLLRDVIGRLKALVGSA
jgi:hypothetical protein